MENNINKLCVDVYNFLTNDHEVVGDLQLTDIGGFLKYYKLKKETRKNVYWHCKIADVPVNIMKFIGNDNYFILDEFKWAKIFLAQSGDDFMYEDYDHYKEDTVTIFLSGCKYYNKTKYIVRTAEILKLLDFTNSEARAIIERYNKAAKNKFGLHSEMRIYINNIEKMEHIKL